MQISHQLSTLTVCWVGLSIGFVGAETPPIYNEACRAEVADFQQASNDEDVQVRRHALLLCLADGAYVAENQIPSDYENWTNTAHFRVFAKDVGVEIGDTQVKTLLPKIEWDFLKGTAKRVPVANPACQFVCPMAARPRASGDPTPSVKDEGFDAYVTIDLGELMSGGTEGFDQLQGVIEEMGSQVTAPFGTEQQVANVIAQMAGIDVKNLEVANPGVGTSLYGTALTDSALRSKCGCPQFVIPVKRASGDGVPGLKYEGPKIFFQMNNFNAPIKAYRLDETIHATPEVPEIK